MSHVRSRAMRGWPTSIGFRRSSWVQRVFLSALALLAVVALLTTVIKWAPLWLAATKGLGASERVQEVARVRTALLAVLAGGIAVVGAYYTARTFALNRQGQITERSRAQSTNW